MTHSMTDSMTKQINQAAVAHFAGRLAYETDVSDVAADIGAGVTGWVLIDSRSQESWDQGHVPGAVHLPTREIAARSAGRRGAGGERRTGRRRGRDVLLGARVQRCDAGGSGVRQARVSGERDDRRVRVLGP
jgi:hypothetical protein